MKKTIFKICLLAIVASTTFMSCNKENLDDEKGINTDLNSEVAAVYILNEGLWKGNNASLTYYTVANGDVKNDFFTLQNGRGLGDVANDIALYNSKVYCVLNGSSTVEVFDATNGKSIKRIDLKDVEGKGREPRNITFWKGKAYVANTDGAVVCIDTESLSVEKVTAAGLNPDGICAANNKLYISNSSDMTESRNTVSIVDIEKFELTKTIEVGVNPGKMKIDAQGNILLLCRGNYADITSCLQKIDTKSDQVETYTQKATGFDISGDYAYMYLSEYGSTTPEFFLLNTQSGSIQSKQFITDGTQIGSIVYGIAVNSYNEDVYICTMMKYDEVGDVYCFDKTGKKKFQIEVGLAPSKLIFIKK